MGGRRIRAAAGFVSDEPSRPGVAPVTTPAVDDVRRSGWELLGRAPLLVTSGRVVGSRSVRKEWVLSYPAFHGHACSPFDRGRFVLSDDPPLQTVRPLSQGSGEADSFRRGWETRTPFTGVGRGGPLFAGVCLVQVYATLLGPFLGLALP